MRLRGFALHKRNHVADKVNVYSPGATTQACRPFEENCVPAIVPEILPAVKRTMLMDWKCGHLSPDVQIRESTKTLRQLEGIFANEDARRAMDPDTAVYHLQAWCPVPEGTEGSLFWGTTTVMPGQVGSEFFMTHGRFHQKRDRTEFYATLEGEGALILMDEKRRTSMKPMVPGGLHFIPPNTAHRVVNIGPSPLRFVACWPSDAGQDYESIRKFGFGARLLNIDRGAMLVESER